MPPQPEAPVLSVDARLAHATSRQLAVRMAVTRALSRARDLDGIYSAALDALDECLGVSRASVLLFDSDGIMRFKAQRGLSSAYQDAVEGHSPWRPGTSDPDPIVVADVTGDPSLAPYLPHITAEGIVGMAFIPLVSVGRVIGKFMLYNDAPGGFTEEAVRLARVIASAVAFAVERARTQASSVASTVDASGRVREFDAMSRDASAPWRQEAFRAGQHQVLEMVATGAPLGQILTLLAHLVDEQCNGELCSIALLDSDGSSVHYGAAPTLPSSLVGQMYGARRPIVVEDILQDPAFADDPEGAVTRGFRACWSLPILSPGKEVLGTFSMYYATPRRPNRDELGLVETAADLAGIAIEHGRFQEALRQSEERNDAILRALPDWIFVMDRDGVFLDFQGRHPEHLLMPPHAFLGRAAAEILPPQLAREQKRALDETFRTGEPATFEYSLELRGELRFYEACLVRSDVDEVLSVVRDITERRRAELEVARQRSELAHLNRALLLGELSGALAHELSQPLAATLMNATAARRLLDAPTPDLPELRSTVDDIIDNGKRAGAVIRRLRTLLKKDEGSTQVFALNEMVEEVLELTRSDLIVRDITVARAFAKDAPSICGDRVQLQQVILNLVLNASEAMMDADPAERRLTIVTSADDGKVKIAVTDEGPGVPEGQLDAIFEPFVTHREQGLGLGLTISRSIVRAHGGEIYAENNAGRGATFCCILSEAAV